MIDRLIEKLSEVDKYLVSRTSLLENAFRALVNEIKNNPVEFVVLHFTYENLESGTKSADVWKFNKHFDNVISHYELDDITNLNCNNNNAYEDFIWAKNIELKYFLTESWLIKCVKNLHIESEINVPIYFKHNYDSMDILNLISGKVMLERAEFQAYCNNAKENCIDVFPKS